MLLKNNTQTSFPQATRLSCFPYLDFRRTGPRLVGGSARVPHHEGRDACALLYLYAEGT